jgi:hypothetical protein
VNTYSVNLKACWEIIQRFQACGIHAQVLKVFELLKEISVFLGDLVDLIIVKNEVGELLWIDILVISSHGFDLLFET